jgi:hypothetical protein
LLTDTEIRKAKAKDTAVPLYTCCDERSLAIPAIILMSAASPQLAALPPTRHAGLLPGARSIDLNFRSRAVIRNDEADTLRMPIYRY